MSGLPQEEGYHLSQLNFLWQHMTYNFSAPKVDLSGRTVLVTGGNAGLGYATVIHFAKANASRIIIASRDIERISTSIAQVYRDVPSYRGKIDPMRVDLYSFESVRAFCKAVRADAGRLDIVIANVGVMLTNFAKTGDGYERVLQVNGLATTLMALLLLPKLAETANLPIPEGSKGLKPTMTIVSSDVHHWARFPEQNTPGSLIEALNDPNQFLGIEERYFTSKILSIFTTRELAKLSAVTSGRVNVTSVNPGLCQSGFRDDMSPLVAKFINLIAWTSEKGSRNFIFASTQNNRPGSYISACKEVPVSTFVVSAKGRETQAKYWKEAVDILRKIAPEMDEVLES